MVASKPTFLSLKVKSPFRFLATKSAVKTEVPNSILLSTPNLRYVASPLYLTLPSVGTFSALVALPTIATPLTGNGPATPSI